MQKKHLIFTLVFSFILLSICSMTSFLFPIHNRVDQNCFMTIGKGILIGQVPYRDLFDHKGPVIYFMHAAAALISQRTFIGVFVMQYVFLAVLITYMYKIACIFCSERSSYLLTLFTSSLILTTNCYLRGDNAEEYVISVMTVSIYYTLKYRTDRCKTIPYSIFFVNGLFIGFVLWLKFNLLGFWIGWALFSFVPLIKAGKFKLFMKSLSSTTLGILLATLPWLIYFLCNNALYNLFFTYFYCNIFLYSKRISFVKRIYYLLESIIKNLALNPIYILILSTGIFCFFFTKKYINDKFCRYNLLSSFVLMYLGVFFSGVWYDYYTLILASFTIFGSIALFDILKSKVSNKITVLIAKNRRKLIITAPAIILLASLPFSNCLLYLNKSKYDFPQYKFAEIINRQENAILLNYGFIDGGFYFASGNQPHNKYFHKVNISEKDLPEMYLEQTKMIQDRSIDFVVVRIALNRAKGTTLCSELFANYKVVSWAHDLHDPYRYILFQRI